MRRNHHMNKWLRIGYEMVSISLRFGEQYSETMISVMIAGIEKSGRLSNYHYKSSGVCEAVLDATGRSQGRVNLE